MEVQDKDKDKALATENTDCKLVFCKVCGATFNDLKNCLKHELVEHPNTQKHFRHRFNAITKLFKKEKTENERTELKAALEQAVAGRELPALLSHYTGDGEKRKACFLHVRDCIESELRCKGRVKVYPFGSMVTGLALNESDIDLFLQIEYKVPCRYANNQPFNLVNSYLRRSEHFTDIFAIRHARVPIIRCKHKLSGYSLDINMSNANSIFNSNFVADLLKLDVRLHELFVFLKIWGKKMKIIGQGSMSSYCLLTLIIYYLIQRGLMPTIKELQSQCPPVLSRGINYAYNLDKVAPLPADLTTLDMIRGFFDYYTKLKVENVVLVPYLGRPLPVKQAFTDPSCFPEYHDQVKAVCEVTSPQPQPFQSDCHVCVQDPFEFQHNVAKSISESNLFYLRQCLILAAHACNNEKLLEQPLKFFDYLLFGITENILTKPAHPQARPAKQLKQRTSITEADKDNESSKSNAKQSEDGNVAETNREANSPMPIMHLHALYPTTADLKTLRNYLQINNPDKIYYHWVKNYMDAIQTILKQIYKMNLVPTTEHKQLEENEPPSNYTWLLSTTLDTWTLRAFQKPTKGGFFNHQIRQTKQFEEQRAGIEAYNVNLRGLLSLQPSDDFKELRIELKPMPGDARRLQRNSPLTKFFRSFKNMFNFFNLKDKSTTE